MEVVQWGGVGWDEGGRKPAGQFQRNAWRRSLNNPASIGRCGETL